MDFAPRHARPTKRPPAGARTLPAKDEREG